MTATKCVGFTASNAHRFLAAIVACCLFLTSVALAQSNPDATTFQNDSYHDGSATFQNFTTTPTAMWTLNLGNRVSYPLIAQGEVYVTAANSSSTTMNLYALNARTGHQDWSAVLQNSAFVPDTATYDNGQVFVFTSSYGHASPTLNAYNASTGAPEWTTTLGPNFMEVSAPPTARNGIVYVGGYTSGTDGGPLTAVRESDGKILWTAPTSGGDNASPAVTNDGVYVSYPDPDTYKFNPTTGAQVWYNGAGGGNAGGGTPAYYNGSLFVRYLIGGTNQMAAINATTGQVTATFLSKPPGSLGYPTIPAFSSGLGYVNAWGTLESFNPMTGAVVWSRTITQDPFVTAPMTINGIVFEGTTSGLVYEFNGATGALLGSIKVGTQIFGPDEQNSTGQPLTGLGAGDGLLVIPAGDTLNVYSVITPEPSTFVLGAVGLLALLVGRRLAR